MTQEDKMLLIKDLSLRLPYAVHVQHTSGFSGTLHNISMYHEYDKNDNVYDIICYTDFFGDGNSITIEHFKPYLFPLSSMTDKQKVEYNSLRDLVPTEQQCEIGNLLGDFEFVDNWRSIEYLIANHFDFRGFIEKGLAIDATGKNIY